MYYLLCTMYYYILIKEKGLNRYWTDISGKKWEVMFLELIFISGCWRLEKVLILQQNKLELEKKRPAAIFGDE